MMVAQHTSPAGHAAELVHMIPFTPLLLPLPTLPPLLVLPPIIVFPPLLALPPIVDPPLDPLLPAVAPPPVLEPVLAAGTAPASSMPLDASPGPGTASSLPPHADRASMMRAMAHGVGPRRAPILKSPPGRRKTISNV
jgi:hypothetical protein